MRCVKKQTTGSSAVNRLHNLCIEKDYYTGSSTSLSYERMQEMARQGKGIDVIASMIYACSGRDVKYEDVYRDVFDTLIWEDRV